MRTRPEAPRHAPTSALPRTHQLVGLSSWRVRPRSWLTCRTQAPPHTPVCLRGRAAGARGLPAVSTRSYTPAVPFLSTICVWGVVHREKPVPGPSPYKNDLTTSHRHLQHAQAASPAVKRCVNRALHQRIPAQNERTDRRKGGCGERQAQGTHMGTRRADGTQQLLSGRHSADKVDPGQQILIQIFEWTSSKMDPHGVVRGFC